MNLDRSIAESAIREVNALRREYREFQADADERLREVRRQRDNASKALSAARKSRDVWKRRCFDAEWAAGIRSKPERNDEAA